MGARDALEAPWGALTLLDKRLDLCLFLNNIDLCHGLEDGSMLVTHLENNNTGVDAWARLEENCIAILVELKGIHVPFNGLGHSLVTPPSDNVLLDFCGVVARERLFVDEAWVGESSNE